MPSPEKPSNAVPDDERTELLIELAQIETAIQPFLETALAIDEIYRLEYLMEIRDGILWELQNLQNPSDTCY